jgi:pantoate--beta-alanine ligase
MHIFKEIGSLKAYLKQRRPTHSTIGLVPTMGCLHAGHDSLVRASIKDNQVTVCSIYVNPTQFNNPADLEKYPRTLDEDLKRLESLKCPAVFCPDDAVMYEEPSTLKFDFGNLDKILEGEFRPGHYSGVALVVSKLFHMVQPDVAYFGQKDFQQFMIISRLVNQLAFGVKVVCAPIVREEDGLAMSSRNVRLGTEERKRANALIACLKESRAQLLKGASLVSIQKDAARQFEKDNMRLEYLALADRHDLTLLDKISDPKDAILLIAAYIGEVRLIDNVFLADN